MSFANYGIAEGKENFILIFMLSFHDEFGGIAGDFSAHLIKRYEKLLHWERFSAENIISLPSPSARISPRCWIIRRPVMAEKLFAVFVTLKTRIIAFVDVCPEHYTIFRVVYDSST